jgi:DNA-binding NarL/FixJ family response regulator
MKRVLVVEHHSQILDALADLVAEEPGLELAGTAGTAREAISLARRLRPDVVLLDVDQPSWHAQRLDHVLSELLPFALLVRLTAATDPDLECLESLANTHRSVLKSAVPDFLRSLTK